MAMHFQIASRRDLKSIDLSEMHRLRATVFKDRLGWEVPVLSGMEIDGYDALDPYYMLIRERGSCALRGCWRLLSTEGSYMLKDSFAALLHGGEAPSHPRIWELSRFAIQTDPDSHFGFSAVTLESFGEMIHYGRSNGIDRFVTVITIGFERLLRRAGVVTTRLGAPAQVGVVKAVALYVEVEATYLALYQQRLAC